MSCEVIKWKCTLEIQLYLIVTVECHTNSTMFQEIYRPIYVLGDSEKMWGFGREIKDFEHTAPNVSNFPTLDKESASNTRVPMQAW